MSAARIDRRLLLAGGAAAAGVAVAGCGDEPPEKRAKIGLHSYGDDPNQVGELLFSGHPEPKGTAVLIHGGYWQAGFDYTLMNPVVGYLIRDGWHTWNIEYRRLNAEGGWPETFEDVADAIDYLANLDGIDVDKVVAVGHSAGGTLAMWAASRTAQTPGGAPRVKLTKAVSLGGVVDLQLASLQHLGGGVVDTFMGGTPKKVPKRYAQGDPSMLAPAACPVVCICGRQDEVVPLSQSKSFVKATNDAGGRASILLVDGTHGDMVLPDGYGQQAVLSTLNRR